MSLGWSGWQNSTVSSGYMVPHHDLAECAGTLAEVSQASCGLWSWLLPRQPSSHLPAHTSQARRLHAVTQWASSRLLACLVLEKNNSGWIDMGEVPLPVSPTFLRQKNLELPTNHWRKNREVTTVTCICIHNCPVRVSNVSDYIVHFLLFSW